MEYVALFVWLLLCVTLGGLMHTILQTPFNYRLIRILAAPGVTLRKLAMAVVALVTGATVTKVNVYNISDRDIGFQGQGVSSVSNVLVPLGPLFASAVVLQIVNAMLGSPVSFNYSPPPVPSLDAGGAKAFLMGMSPLVSGLVKQGLVADWGSLRFYVLLGCVLSLSLGACVSFEKFREAVLGSLLLVAALAVICALAGVRSGLGSTAVSTLAESPAAPLVRSVRTFLTGTTGVAFIMMLCGMMVAIVVGIVVRLYQLMISAAGGKSNSGTRESRGEKRQAA